MEPLNYYNSENQSFKYIHISLVKYSSTLLSVSVLRKFITWQVYEKGLESAKVRDWIGNLLYRTAVIEGSVLYQCHDEEQANRWVQHFKRNLPTDRGACVIRENELNIYSQ